MAMLDHSNPFSISSNDVKLANCLLLALLALISSRPFSSWSYCNWPYSSSAPSSCFVKSTTSVFCQALFCLFCLEP